MRRRHGRSATAASRIGRSSARSAADGCSSRTETFSTSDCSTLTSAMTWPSSIDWPWRDWVVLSTAVRIARASERAWLSSLRTAP
jgi:hypothetical protein